MTITSEHINIIKSFCSETLLRFQETLEKSRDLIFEQLKKYPVEIVFSDKASIPQDNHDELLFRCCVENYLDFALLMRYVDDEISFRKYKKNRCNLPNIGPYR
jgi:hypothetical protein